MFMPVVQVGIVRMLMGYGIMAMKMRMPFFTRYALIIMDVHMVAIGMLMVMDVFHFFMAVNVFMG